MPSLPTRGAWIEISPVLYASCAPVGSLPTRGAWIEIRLTMPTLSLACCRSPHGERGLKYVEFVKQIVHVRSLPTRGAWIEIVGNGTKATGLTGRSPHGERGLKYAARDHHRGTDWSLPTRGAWIEIVRYFCLCARLGVAPHTGSVD